MLHVFVHKIREVTQSQILCRQCLVFTDEGIETKETDYIA